LRREARGSPPHVRLVTDGADVLPGYPGLARWLLRRRLAAAGIGVHRHCAVREVGPNFLRVGDGITFDNDATFWAAGAAAHAFLRASGLQVDERGFIAVNAGQQSVSHPEVFAAGDCATRVDDPLPKSGVYAVRAGPALAANLKAFIAGEPLRPHRPQRLHLSLLAAGNGSAVGAWGPASFAGHWAWRWKDRIDRAFIGRYAATPPPR
jgi:selenide,water dikinase